MYKYYFKLTPANPESKINYLENKDLLNIAVKKVNDGIAFRRDHKKIEILEIKSKCVKIILECSTPLQRSSKSISTLTRALTCYDIFKKERYNKTIFYIELEKQESNEDLVSDVMNKKELVIDFMNFLYEYCPSNKLEEEYYKKSMLEISKILSNFKNNN